MNALSKVAVLVALMIGGGLAGGCSSSSTPAAPPPCNQAPFECESGQTCWVTDETPTFACLNSGPGKVGSSCQSLVGSPECGDGLICLQTTPGSSGECLQFCDPTDPAHACPNAGPCEQAAFNSNASSSFYVCITAAADAGMTPADAGKVHEAGTD